MKIAFRVDSSFRTGTGHVRRCLALARALRARGAECQFLCQPLEGNITSEIRLDGFEVFDLSADPTDGTPLDADFAATARLLSVARPNCLVVDHYKLGEAWERQALQLVERCIVIDDLARRHAGVDLVVDPTPGENRLNLYEAALPGTTLAFLGPRYALLRDAFAAKRPSVAARSGSIGRCLVNFGGTNTVAMCDDALRAIRAALGESVAVDVVVPPSPTAAKSLDAASAVNVKIIPHATAAQMAELMSNADLAIGAAGGASWERACLGLPAVVTAIAANQNAVLEAIVNAGAAVEIANDANYVTALSKMLQDLAAAPERMRQMSERASGLVDGKGAERLARFILRPAIGLRRAGEGDRRLIWAWRNEAHVRAVSFNQAPIPWESHSSWYDGVLRSPERALLVCEMEGQGAGVVRFDLAAGEAVISLYLNAVGRGKGIGADLLRASEQWLRAHHPQVRRIVAEILDTNLPSIATFEAARYHRRAGKHVRELVPHESV
jgi:UDP-2,4-diacetamido-2,4,6-trideoxy-beta-L-altropyranose hydrolase